MNHCRYFKNKKNNILSFYDFYAFMWTAFNNRCKDALQHNVSVETSFSRPISNVCGHWNWRLILKRNQPQPCPWPSLRYVDRYEIESCSACTTSQGGHLNMNQATFHVLRTQRDGRFTLAGDSFLFFSRQNKYINIFVASRPTCWAFN